jgi:hypothetical protein
MGIVNLADSITARNYHVVKGARENERMREGQYLSEDRYLIFDNCQKRTPHVEDTVVDKESARLSDIVCSVDMSSGQMVDNAKVLA